MLVVLMMDMDQLASVLSLEVSSVELLCTPGNLNALRLKRRKVCLVAGPMFVAFVGNDSSFRG